MTAIELFIPGKPTPKGSWNAINIEGKARMVPNNKRTKPWCNRVQGFVLAHCVSLPGLPTTDAVVVECNFIFSRPKSHLGKTGLTAAGRRFPHPTGGGKQGDLDKLLRNVWDAMTGIVFDDDRQVVRTTACKVWGRDEGVLVRVYGAGNGEVI